MTPARWPRIEIRIRGAREGSFLFNGVEYQLQADDLTQLRPRLLARAVAQANVLGRPVLVEVSEAGVRQELVVVPDGRVLPVDGLDDIEDPDLLPPVMGPCRWCGEAMAIDALSCDLCGRADPHGLEETVSGGSAGRRVAEGLPVDGSTAVAPERKRRSGRRAAYQLADSDVPSLCVAVNGTMTPIPPEGLVMGRKPVAGAGESLVLESPRRMVSRTHATLRLDNGAGGLRVTLTDEGSANGSYVNGKRIPSGVPVEVNPTDLIRCGDVMMRIAVG